MTRQKDEEMVARPGRRDTKGGASRGDTTTSWHNERTRVRCNKGQGELMQQQAGNKRVAQLEDGERQCNNQLAGQDDKRATQ